METYFLSFFNHKHPYKHKSIDIYDQPNTTLCDYAISVVVLNMKKSKKHIDCTKKKETYKNTQSKGYTHTI